MAIGRRKFVDKRMIEWKNRFRNLQLFYFSSPTHSHRRQPIIKGFNCSPGYPVPLIAPPRTDPCRSRQLEEQGHSHEEVGNTSGVDVLKKHEQ